MKQFIPHIDFGGQGEVIHFAHANGFPPKTYQMLVDKLIPHYRVISMSARPLWSNSRIEDFKTWHQGADDLIRFLDEQGLSNVIGMGHSFGAICTLIAANKRPDLFKKLVLIEPVVLPKWYYWFTLIAPKSLVKQINPIVKKTLVRTDKWTSQEAAYRQFRNNRLFANTNDAALWDYVNCGTAPNNNGGVSLRYSKEWEATIYLTITNPWKELKQLRQPFLVIRGETSDTIFPSVWKKMKGSIPNGKYIEFIDSGHIIPLEKPAEIAETISSFLNSN
ncbi:MAG: alpha/beta hydrolase [Flavobacteriales bacterium]|nr:alpha/beta hydrolase [Flavobacteriales bacterium]